MKHNLTDLQILFTLKINLINFYVRKRKVLKNQRFYINLSLGQYNFFLIFCCARDLLQRQNYKPGFSRFKRIPRCNDFGMSRRRWPCNFKNRIKNLLVY